MTRQGICLYHDEEIVEIILIQQFCFGKYLNLSQSIQNILLVVVISSALEQAE